MRHQRLGEGATAVGLLTQVRTSLSTTNCTGYDPLGRLTDSTQTTSGQGYSFQYRYDLSGALTQEVYRSRLNCDERLRRCGAALQREGNHGLASARAAIRM